MKRFFLILLAIVALASCRHEEPIIKPTTTVIHEMTSFDGGFYLLNEGNMGSNKCTLDWYDGKERTYWKNIFAYRNPSVSMELGDVGNDLKIHGDRLFAVINCSNLVEVMTLENATHVAQIAIPNCRYICFDDNYAYVSSYAGEILSGPSDRLGYVARIKLSTLELDARCEVGYQPEEMVIKDGKLYVANSGGYNDPNYDNRVSVIDLETFTLTEHIEVAINLHHMALGYDGTIWVSSRGDYKEIKSTLHAIKSGKVYMSDIPCEAMAIYGKYIYGYGEGRYYILDTDTMALRDFRPSVNIKTPYCITVCPFNGDIMISDAGDYVTPGHLYSFYPDGELRWSVTTGDIPSSIAWY